MLFKYRVDLEIKNNEGFSIIDYAKREKFKIGLYLSQIGYNEK